MFHKLGNSVDVNCHKQLYQHCNLKKTPTFIFQSMSDNIYYNIQINLWSVVADYIESIVMIFHQQDDHESICRSC